MYQIFLQHGERIFFNLFIFWLHWVLVAVPRLSLAVMTRGYSVWCTGFSLRCLLLLWSMVSGYTGPVVVVQELSCSAACGIFLNQEGIHQRILVTSLLTTVLVECIKMSALPVPNVRRKVLSIFLKA